MSTLGIVSTILAGIVALLSIIASLIKYRQQIKEWWEKKTCWRTTLLDHEKRLEKVEESVNTINTNLCSLSDDYKKNTKESKEYRRSALGDKIFNHTEKYDEQGYITQLQWENYMLCIRRYKDCIPEGDEDYDLILHDCLPLIEALPKRKEHPRNETQYHE